MKTTNAVAALSALAQADRLKVFRHLVRAGPQGLPAGMIAKACRVSGPTLSFHLAKLVAAGLAWTRREGRFVYYGPEIEAVNGLADFLTQECCGGQPDMCRPGAKRKC